MKKKSKYLYFLILLVVTAIIFYIEMNFCILHTGDDLVYEKVLDDQSMWTFLTGRYRWWSSRVVIELFMVPMAMYPWIWRIVNAIMVMLLLVMTGRVFGKNRTVLFTILFSLFLWTIPMISIHSAGWITTTTNYLWVLALGLVALYPLSQWIQGRSLRWWQYLLCSLATIYAANMEQMVAVLTGAYLVGGIYLLIKKKRFTVWYLIQCLLIIASLIFILKSKGNAHRSLYELERYLPEFTGMTLIDKSMSGFLYVSQYYISGAVGKVVMLVISLVVAIGALTRKKKKVILKLISTIPFLFCLFITVIMKALLPLGIVKHGLVQIETFWNNNRYIGYSSYSNTHVMIQILVYMIIWICLLIGIYTIHGKSQDTFWNCIILVAGILSVVIVGFSPTIYASGDRTILFCTAAFLIITVRELMYMLKKIYNRILG